MVGSSSPSPGSEIGDVSAAGQVVLVGIIAVPDVEVAMLVHRRAVLVCFSL
jgi:hypothetical protein